MPAFLPLPDPVLNHLDLQLDDSVAYQGSGDAVTVGVKVVVCGRPAEPEGAMHPEEALPGGGGGPALSLPGEHAHSGSSLQQPCLPSGMEPWALVSGKWELLES